MSYTPTSWSTGDTITAAAMNKIENGIANASPYDAIIRLTHSNDSGEDVASNLTPSIISGSYAALSAKINNSEFPHVIVQYYHPWGYWGWLEGYITYVNPYNILITVAGYFPFGNNGACFYHISSLMWSSSDTIEWN